MFQNVDAYAGDPILSLMEAFNRIPGQTKLTSASGCTITSRPLFPSWRRSVRPLTGCSQQQKASLYLPMEGWRPIAARSRPCCLATIIRRCVPDASPPSRHWGLRRAKGGR